MLSSLVSLLFFLPAFSFAQAGGGLLFGPEWTFTNPQIIKTSYQLETLDLTSQRKTFERMILEKCGTCQKIHEKIYFAEGLWIWVSVDNKVIEVNSSPMTISQMKQHQQLIQALVWQTALELGLKPHSRIGGGHIHIEKPYVVSKDFKSQAQARHSWSRRLGLMQAPTEPFSLSLYENPDILILRNFLVDLWNTPELFLGGLGFNLRSAPPLSTLSAEKIRIIARKVSEFDMGQLSIETLFRQINGIYANHVQGTSRNQAVNLESEETIEIRGIKPQESFVHYILLCEFLEASVRRAAKMKEPIPFKVPTIEAWDSITDGILQYHSSLSAEEIERVFKQKVESLGLDWKNYESLLTVAVKEELQNKKGLQRAPFCSRIFSLGH